jgi:hypothetical protein
MNEIWREKYPNCASRGVTFRGKFHSKSLYSVKKRLWDSRSTPTLVSVSFFSRGQKVSKIVNIGVMRKDRAAQQRLFSGTILIGLTQPFIAYGYKYIFLLLFLFYPFVVPNTPRNVDWQLCSRRLLYNISKKNSFNFLNAFNFSCRQQGGHQQLKEELCRLLLRLLTHLGNIWIILILKLLRHLHMARVIMEILLKSK